LFPSKFAYDIAKSSFLCHWGVSYSRALLFVVKEILMSSNITTKTVWCHGKTFVLSNSKKLKTSKICSFFS